MVDADDEYVVVSEVSDVDGETSPSLLPCCHFMPRCPKREEWLGSSGSNGAGVVGWSAVCGRSVVWVGCGVRSCGVGCDGPEILECSDDPGQRPRGGLFVVEPTCTITEAKLRAIDTMCGIYM